MSTAMMAITTSSSTSVKPRCRAVVKCRGIAAPRGLGETAGRDEFSIRPAGGSLMLRDFHQRRQVPDFHRVVTAAGVQPPAVGAERQATDQTGVAAEAADQVPAPAIPDLHGAVFACGGDPAAVVVGA